MAAPTLIKYASGLQEALVFERLSITELDKFIKLLCDERNPELVAHCARRNLAWVDTLDEDCYLELSSKFIRENFPRAVKASQNHAGIALKVGPMIHKMGQLLELLHTEGYAITPGDGANTGIALPNVPGLAAALVGSSPASTTTPPSSSEAS